MTLSKGLFFLFWAIFIKKITLLLYFSTEGLGGVLGGGRDSDYYHDYAVGYEDFAVNLWPLILRELELIGIYSREGVSVVLFALASLVLPFLIARLPLQKGSLHRSAFFWGGAVFISLYPTIVFYSLDVYRDVFMLCVFSVGLYVFKKLPSARGVRKAWYIFLGVVFSWVLYLLRPYLGFGFFVTLLAGWWFSFARARLFLLLCLFSICCYSLLKLGFLDPLMSYREGFVGGEGGTTFGIDMYANFFEGFLLSFVYQVFGVYFVGGMSIFVFFVESVPFLFAFLYVIINRRYSDKLVDYLMVFFVVYSSIWIIGNDNLGTAVRLRVFSYIAIYVAFVSIFQKKYLARYT